MFSGSQHLPQRLPYRSIYLPGVSSWSSFQISQQPLSASTLPMVMGALSLHSNLPASSCHARPHTRAHESCLMKFSEPLWLPPQPAYHRSWQCLSVSMTWCVSTELELQPPDAHSISAFPHVHLSMASLSLQASCLKQLSSVSKHLPEPQCFKFPPLPHHSKIHIRYPTAAPSCHAVELQPAPWKHITRILFDINSDESCFTVFLTGYPAKLLRELLLSLLLSRYRFQMPKLWKMTVFLHTAYCKGGFMEFSDTLIGSLFYTILCMSDEDFVWSSPWRRLYLIVYIFSSWLDHILHSLEKLTCCDLHVSHQSIGRRYFSWAMSLFSFSWSYFAEISDL